MPALEETAAEKPAAGEAETPAEEEEQVVTEEISAEEIPAEMPEMDDTVRLDDLSGITGTAPSCARTLEDKTERFRPVGAVRIDEEDEDEDYDLDAYYEWVCGNGHDHAFVAERVGLDLDACRDDEVDYTIQL